jgi:GT2 family glycosyltransferase
MNNGYTYIVLLNWNGWRDTIACLESLCALDHPRVKIVVCDNHSTDGSLANIQAWCRGELAAELPDNERLQATMRVEPAQVPYTATTASAVFSGDVGSGDSRVVLIDNEANLGFAGGNNVGLRYALQQSDMSHAWILNNDTVVDSDCLDNMLRRLEREDAPAVCGSMIHFFDNPSVIQAIGGNRFNTRTGVALQSEGRFLDEGEVIDIAAIERGLDYISGCSLLIPRELLERVGLLNDDYFLYYEEIDWFTRAGASVRRCVAADARVYHREGGSIGSPSWRESTPSQTADLHIFRSKHLFMRRFHPQNLVPCYLSTAIEAAKRVARGQFRNALVVLSVLFGATSAGQ